MEKKRVFGHRKKNDLKEEKKNRWFDKAFHMPMDGVICNQTKRRLKADNSPTIIRQNTDSKQTFHRP